MKEELEKIYNNFLSEEVSDLKKLESLRIEYLGKNGIIKEYLDKLKDLSNEEKREYGKYINEIKTKISTFLDAEKEKLEQNEINKKLENEKIDITMPGTNINVGSAHMLEKTIESLEELFISLGFDVLEGPEVESDYFNFEMLNLPKGHPARDAQDTFYITDDMLLRSQTSPVQIRTMMANSEKTQIRMVCSGKTYRRDNDDATHSHQFTQMEGLVVDKNISLSDLKGTMEIIAKHLFGITESRFRPSYYPFTEPSVEFDIRCHNCKGKGCAICKETGWITVGGAGIVHPNVLRNGGYDPDKYTGYAFGLGIERLTMIKYGIKDIRAFYTNDLRCKNMDIREAQNEN